MQAWVWLRGVAESQWAAQDAGRLCTKGIYNLHRVGQHKSKEVLYQHDVDVAVFDSINVEVNFALDAGSLYTRGIMSTSIRA